MPDHYYLEDDIIDKLNLEKGKYQVRNVREVDGKYEADIDYFLTHASHTNGEYHLLTDKWVISPIFIEEDWDAETIYKTIVEEAKGLASEFDVNIGEIEREILNIEMLEESINSFKGHPDKIKFFKDKIEEKLTIIEKDIEEMVQKGEETHEKRKEQFTEGEDVGGRGIKFKYLQRHSYIWLYKKLEDLLKNGIDEEELPKIKKIIKEQSMDGNFLKIFNVLKKKSVGMKEIGNEMMNIEGSILSAMGFEDVKGRDIPVFVEGSLVGKEYISVIGTEGHLKGKRFKVSVQDLKKIDAAISQESSEYTDVVKQYYKDHPETKVGDSEAMKEIKKIYEEKKKKASVYSSEDFNVFEKFFVKSNLSFIEDWYADNCPDAFGKAVSIKKEAKYDWETLKDMYDFTVRGLDDDDLTKMSYLKRLCYIQYTPGHEVDGINKPWTIRQHDTGKILQSYKTESEAEEGLKRIQKFKHMKKSDLKKESVRTIGFKWINEIKKKIRDNIKQHMTPWGEWEGGGQQIRDDVIEELPQEVFDIWESAYSEIEGVIDDYISDALEIVRKEKTKTSFLKKESDFKEGQEIGYHGREGEIRSKDVGGYIVYFSDTDEEELISEEELREQGNIPKTEWYKESSLYRQSEIEKGEIIRIKQSRTSGGHVYDIIVEKHIQGSKYQGRILSGPNAGTLVTGNIIQEQQKESSLKRKADFKEGQEIGYHGREGVVRSKDVGGYIVYFSDTDEEELISEEELREQGNVEASLKKKATIKLRPFTQSDNITYQGAEAPEGKEPMIGDIKFDRNYWVSPGIKQGLKGVIIVDNNGVGVVSDVGDFMQMDTSYENGLKIANKMYEPLSYEQLKSLGLDIESSLKKKADIAQEDELELDLGSIIEITEGQYKGMKGMIKSEISPLLNYVDVELQDGERIQISKERIRKTSSLKRKADITTRETYDKYKVGDTITFKDKKFKLSIKEPYGFMFVLMDEEGFQTKIPAAVIGEYIWRQPLEELYYTQKRAFFKKESDSEKQEIKKNEWEDQLKLYRKDAYDYYDTVKIVPTPEDILSYVCEMVELESGIDVDDDTAVSIAEILKLETALLHQKSEDK